MQLDTWLAFVAASAVLLVIPGPTVLLVVSYALSQGRRVAFSTAGGVALGYLVTMTASLAGLGALVLASATAFTWLKWVGAVYLVWLGVRLIRSAGTDDARFAASGPVTARRTFVHAAGVTALNPKSIAFFVAFVPQFLNPSAPLLPQFVTMIASFVTLATLNALSFAFVADAMRARLLAPGAIAWLTRAGGVSLIAMGLLTASLRRVQG
ncbi:LysE family translocator [Roseibacterium sp. SDUM158016]|uniref:LysE family translocator n=1 Tax=Roseicyclus sediminis TaxID=2980997 RepID=UPI0021D1E161|nr:LysE family translocator [Roseibacterium sp. SDUM158016]MCU4653953.1 LysE family translocator [Roseibacterium sp. SDUM158016]